MPTPSASHDPDGARNLFERFKVQPNDPSPGWIGYFDTILTVKTQANIAYRATPADLRQFVCSKDIPTTGNQRGRFDDPIPTRATVIALKVS